jgi:hypothetical protein
MTPKEVKLRRRIDKVLRLHGLRVTHLRPCTDPQERRMRAILPWAVVKIVSHTSGGNAFDVEVGRYQYYHVTP